jgi:hypothetical protein
LGLLQIGSAAVDDVDEVAPVLPPVPVPPPVPVLPPVCVVLEDDAPVVLPPVVVELPVPVLEPPQAGNVHHTAAAAIEPNNQTIFMDSSASLRAARIERLGTGASVPGGGVKGA